MGTPCRTVTSSRSSSSIASAGSNASCSTIVAPAASVPTTTLKPKIVHLDYDPSHSSTATVIAAGKHDIVVLGAENRAVRKRLFFGYENQRIIDLEFVTTVILVPNFSRIH